MLLYLSKIFWLLILSVLRNAIFWALYTVTATWSYIDFNWCLAVAYITTYFWDPHFFFFISVLWNMLQSWFCFLFATKKKHVWSWLICKTIWGAHRLAQNPYITLNSKIRPYVFSLRNNPYVWQHWTGKLTLCSS